MGKPEQRVSEETKNILMLKEIIGHIEIRKQDQTKIGCIPWGCQDKYIDFLLYLVKLKDKENQEVKNELGLLRRIALGQEKQIRELEETILKEKQELVEIDLGWDKKGD